MARSLKRSRNQLRRRNPVPRRKLFVVIGEGENTEKDYFSLLDTLGHDHGFSVRYVALKNHHGGSPFYLVKEAKAQEAQTAGQGETEFWIVADVERESVSRDLNLLFEWVEEGKKGQKGKKGGEQRNSRHLGLTCQQFENWLLLHWSTSMESGNPTDKIDREYIRDYKKNGKRLTSFDVSFEQMREAIERAKNQGRTVPSQVGRRNWGQKAETSVWELVDELLSMAGL